MSRGWRGAMLSVSCAKVSALLLLKLSFYCLFVYFVTIFLNYLFLGSWYILLSSITPTELLWMKFEQFVFQHCIKVYWLFTIFDTCIKTHSWLNTFKHGSRSVWIYHNIHNGSVAQADTDYEWKCLFWKKKLEDTGPFRGATDTPFLDF